jgi:arylsulfatase
MSLSLNRRKFGTALAAGLLGSRAARAQQPPNVLVLLTSELRADAISAMGASIVRTLAIDALARQGCLLRRAITATPEPGARGGMAVLTGRYPSSRGVEGTVEQSYSGALTLPEIFGGHGYQTAVIGQPPPALAKVDAKTIKLFPEPDYRAYLDENYPTFEGDYSRLTAPLGVPPEGPPPWRIGEAALPVTAFPTRWIADQTLEFLQAGKESGPWCCVTAFAKPREPYIVPNPWATRYQLERIPMPDLPAIRPLPETAANEARDYAVASQAEVMRRLLRAYFGAIGYIDDEVQRIVLALRVSGQLDNTIIAIVGETGHMLGDHGRMFGAVPYEGAIRVPGILRYPPAIEPNGRIEGPVSTTSLAPTLLELAGLKSTQEFHSASLAPLLKDSSKGAKGEAFSAMGFETVQTEGWKLTEPGDHPTWEPQLFDLQADPREENNVYGKPEAAKAQEELAGRLESWRERMG